MRMHRREFGEMLAALGLSAVPAYAQAKTVEVTGTASGTGTLDTCLNAQFNPPTLCARVPIVGHG